MSKTLSIVCPKTLSLLRTRPFFLFRARKVIVVWDALKYLQRFEQQKDPRYVSMWMKNECPRPKIGGKTWFAMSEKTSFFVNGNIFFWECCANDFVPADRGHIERNGLVLRSCRSQSTYWSMNAICAA